MNAVTGTTKYNTKKTDCVYKSGSKTGIFTKKRHFKKVKSK